MSPPRCCYRGCTATAHVRLVGCLVVDVATGLVAYTCAADVCAGHHARALEAGDECGIDLTVAAHY